MQDLSFIKVHKDLQSNSAFEQIYSKFAFLYLPLTSTDQKSKNNDVENYLYNYLKDFKFMTYQFADIKQSLFQAPENAQEATSNSSDKIINIIICVEEKCLIIERIDFLMIKKIIAKLKEQPQTAIISASKKFGEIKKEEIEANEEIDGLIEFFRYKIQNNKFITYTIRPIAEFLIRRYFYPTHYFKDPSFFTFKNSKESELKNGLIQTLNSKESSQFYYNFNQLIQNENQNQDEEKNEFKQDDFIELRTLYASNRAVFNLVIHIKSLYIFMMKKVQSSQNNEKEIDHETHFCKNFSHHCLTKFYGFVKINENTKGFIYEFLCNHSLKYFIKNHPKRNDDLYKLLTINRLFQGIQYLHLNKLIHRDLKPSNILLDHDFIPYISDFDEIRHFDTNEKMTVDLGNIFYTSPEQDNGDNLTSSTDIYSFGKIIYFLYEKRDDSSQDKSIITQISTNIKIPKNINKLYQLCCQYEPEKRINHQSIKLIIIDEINSFSYLEHYLINETNDFYSMFVIQYLLENMHIKMSLTLFSLDIINLRRLFFIKINGDYSLFFLSLGIFYCNGFYTKQDYLKAIYYFELAAMENNSEAFLYLGIIYYKGFGVNQDDSKAIEYFELSAKLNNSEALYFLGIFYFKGIIVKQNYLKARNYFELSSKQNNPKAFLFLGIIYYYGYGVIQDYLKSIEYFELSANLNNSNAITYLSKLNEKGFKIKQDCLIKDEKFEEKAKESMSIINLHFGMQYENKNGDHHDYLKAKKYYELAANQNNSEALFKLGTFYYNGYGVKQDYLKAKEYFELAIKQNNPDAFYYLGNIYINGFIDDKDYSKAIEYYESAINLNNSKACLKLEIQIREEIGIEQEGLAFKSYDNSTSKQSNSILKIEQEGLATTGINDFSSEQNSSILGIEQEGLATTGINNFSSEQNSSILGIEQEGLATTGINNFSSEQNSYAFEIKLEGLATSDCLSNSLINLGKGLMYLFGYNVKQDYSKAKKYLELAADQNNPDAFFYLGNIYINGYGVEKNPLKAIECYEIAAEQNNSEALYNLGIVYYFGCGIEKDYIKSRKYFELAAKQNNVKSLVNLGVIYLRGNGIDQNYLKAIEYFELAAKKNNAVALLNLGFIYSFEFGVTRDYLKAIKYFELSAEQNCSESFLNLGYLYYEGLGVQRDVLKAINYFKMAAKQNNSCALFNLGIIYYFNDINKRDYLKAKEYFEAAAKLNNSYALLYLGYMYYNGYGIQQDYIMALNYYELSANLNNPEALFNLGCFYSNKEEFIDLSKAIECLLKCFEIHYQTIFIKSDKDKEGSSSFIEYNYYCYRSANDVGLIYLVYLNDLENATKYIKEAAFGEYPFGQNNFGLLNQFYLNNIQEAEYFYNKSSKQEFCLAEFNLGYLKEKEEKFDESIKFYIKASKHQEKPLIFQKNNHYDERLEISKTFIMCLTNLKLAAYYLSESKYVESKKYFIKAYEKLYLKTENNSIYKFQLIIKKDNNFLSYLKSFILLYPLFNLKNQPYQNIKNYLNELNLNVNDNDLLTNELQNSKISNEENEKFKNQKEEVNTLKMNNFNLKEFKNKIDNYEFNKPNKIYNYESNKPNKIDVIHKSKYVENKIFTDPGELFDFVIEDEKLIEKFINEMKNTISSMETILFMKPYPILFGRINMNNPKFKPEHQIKNPYIKNIDKDFYDGFDLEI